MLIGRLELENWRSPIFFFSSDYKRVRMRTQITHSSKRTDTSCLSFMLISVSNKSHHCGLSKSLFGLMTPVRGIPAMDVTWRDYPILHSITNDAFLSIDERSKFTLAETSGTPFHLWWDSIDKAQLMGSIRFVLIQSWLRITSLK